MGIAGIRGAVRTVRDRPAALVAGLVIGLADVASLVAVGFGLNWLLDGRPIGLVLALLGRVCLLATVALVLPGLYAIVRGETDGLRSSLTTLRRTGRRSGSTLLLSSLAAHAVALGITVPVAIVAVTGTLGLDTLAQVVVPGDPWRWRGSLLAVVVAVLLAGFLARLPFAFHDLIALDGESTPSRAWRRSYRATMARPRALLAYGLPRFALLAAPAAAAIGAGMAVEPIAEGAFGIGRERYAIIQATVLGTFVLASTVARPLLAAYHVRVADEGFSFHGLGTEQVDIVPRARTVVAALVVLAAVAGGAAAVRAADAGQSPAQPAMPAVGEDDPSTVLDAANQRTATSTHSENHRFTTYNDTSGEWAQTVAAQLRIDHADRQLLVTVRGQGQLPNVTEYTEDGMVAWKGYRGSGGTARALGIRERRGNWAVETGPPDRYLERAGNGYPNASLPWRVVDRTDDAVVYGLSDPAMLHEVGGYAGYFPAPDREEITYRENNSVRVAVDRDSGRLAWIRAQSSYERFDEYDNETEVRGHRRTVTFENYGSTDVERPAALGGQHPYATLWDVIDY